MERKFDPKKLAKLNNPERLKKIDIDYILSKLSYLPEKVADIGAGTGFLTQEFLKRWPDCEIDALDISPAMVDWMKENLSSESLKRLHPRLMTENGTGLEGESVDLVLSICLHHELDQPEVFLRECYRILSQKGKIAIIDWKKEKMEMGPPIQIRMPREGYFESLKLAGYSDISIFDDMPEHHLVIAVKN